MSTQNYNTSPSRITIRAEPKLLKTVEHNQVITKFGEHKEQPLRESDTLVFRRMDAYNAASNGTPQITTSDFLVPEGTTPDAHTIDWTDVSVTLDNYGILFKLTSKAALMYNDSDIPKGMIEQTGRVLAQIDEMNAYQIARAGSSVIYANGSTRAGLNTAISLARLQQAARVLTNALAAKVTKTIAPGPNFDTHPVEDSFVVIFHPDLMSDIRKLPGFTKRVEYGSHITPIHEKEVGACEDFRFVPSTLFAPFLAAGSATLNGMVSAGGANTDVYPLIVLGEEALGHVALKGHGVSGVKPTYLPPSMVSHYNPMATFGFVGGSFWGGHVRLNENFMVRIECCATKLID